MKTSRYDSQRADGTNKWDDCPRLKVCPAEATQGQTARGRRLQPQSEAVISGHGRVCRSADSVRESGDPNLRTPRLAELANSCSLDGHVLDEPKRRAMGRERTWPNHARHPPRQDLAWAISEGLREPDGKGAAAAGARRPG